MYFDDSYIGCCNMEHLRALNNKLSARVEEQVNENQELLMLNNFAREANESQFKRCIQDRISDIASWRWVLEDLAKRLIEAIDSLQYEHNAMHVVVDRIKNELEGQAQESLKAGTFGPLTDAVEDAIIQEYNFLRDQKKKFDKMIPLLEEQINMMRKVKKRIDTDILHKSEALSVEQACANIGLGSYCRVDNSRKKKKRGSPISRWENRCAFLKRSGLRALGNALVTRQQVRGARVHLSIAAQSYAARVDSALRKRLHANKIKLQDLKWQKEEALRDYKSLAEEITATEQNILQTMEQERVVEARLADRALRPARELTKDEVGRKLKDELGRLKSFNRQLRCNLDRITTLQNHLMDAMARIECFTVDLIQVIDLDEERLRIRLGDDLCDCSVNPSQAPPAPPDLAMNCPQNHTSRPASSNQLPAIQEENEETNGGSMSSIQNATGVNLPQL